MKQQLTYTNDSLQLDIQTKQDLYNKYGGMLLGFITEVVKIPATAEQYLVDIFSDLQFGDIQAITQPHINTFCQLQIIARKKLADFVATLNDCAEDERPKGIVVNGNRFTKLMAPDQQVVFCGMHYHGKSTAAMAAELNKPEDTIRQLLKESFSIIRNDTSAVHR